MQHHFDIPEAKGASKSPVTNSWFVCETKHILLHLKININHSAHRQKSKTNLYSKA